MRYEVTLILIVLCQLMFGQIHFKDMSSTYLGDQRSRSAVMIGFQDMNGDYADDLITLNEGRYLWTAINRGKGAVMDVIYSPEPVSPGREWSFSIGDIDNDNIPEIFTAGVYNDLKVFSFDPDLRIFTHKQSIYSHVYGQGCNIIDIDLDGMNDFFLCHDEGMSRVFMNDGNGKLSQATDIIDFSTDPPTDMSGNYGSEWVDIDDDGIPELYMAKCRAGATSYQDPRRINQLYKRGDDGIFRDIAPSIGLDLGHQSWSAVFSDLDNDGDLDVIIVNHYDRHMILENIDGFFTERELEIEIPETFAFQVMTADLNNSGWEDIIFTGDQDIVLRNLGNFKFEIIHNAFSTQPIHSAAIGDVNGDGFVDLYCSFGKPVIELGNRFDALYVNEGNENHHLVFSLRGVESNSRGVGGKIKLYGPWGIQQRNIRSGQGYSIVHSTNAYFGLGQHVQIDSAVIIWPGGGRQILHHLEADEHYIVYENSCAYPKGKIHTNGSLTLCPGETITLNSDKEYKSVIWNNGDHSSDITIDRPGTMHYFYISDEGCMIPSELIRIAKYTVFENATVFHNDILEVCGGQNLSFPADIPGQFTWMKNDQESNLVPEVTGYYVYEWIQSCGFRTLDSIYINVISPEIEEVLKDTIFKGEKAELYLQGDAVKWFLSKNDENPVHTGSSYVTPPLYESVIYYVEREVSLMRDTLKAGPIFPYGENRYTGNNINASMHFEVFETTVLQSVDVYTDTEAPRIFIIGDFKGDTLHSVLRTLLAGKNTIEMELELDPGRYFISTDEKYNLKQLGIHSPRLERTVKDFVFFPYTASNILSIEGSESGENYFYFYNWNILRPFIPCRSERVPYEVIVDFSNSIEEQKHTTSNIFPNPAKDFINISISGLGEEVEVSLRDINGRFLKRYIVTANGGKISLEGLPAGIYFLSLPQKSGLHTWKFVKYE